MKLVVVSGALEKVVLEKRGRASFVLGHVYHGANKYCFTDHGVVAKDICLLHQSNHFNIIAIIEKVNTQWTT